MAGKWKWPQEERTYGLMHLLTGKAQKVYTAIEQKHADVYDQPENPNKLKKSKGF